MIHLLISQPPVVRPYLMKCFSNRNMHLTSWLQYTVHVRILGVTVWFVHVVCLCWCFFDSPAVQHRSSVLEAGASPGGYSPDWATRVKSYHALPRTVPAASLRLLVAMSAQLSEEQYSLLMPSLWNQHLEEASLRVAAPVR
jgi:hypothetical protein